jgi:hypothetical protein
MDRFRPRSPGLYLMFENCRLTFCLRLGGTRACARPSLNAAGNPSPHADQRDYTAGNRAPACQSTRTFSASQPRLARTRADRSCRQLRRFRHIIDPAKVFGTHSSPHLASKCPHAGSHATFNTNMRSKPNLGPPFHPGIRAVRHRRHQPRAPDRRGGVDALMESPKSAEGSGCSVSLRTWRDRGS